ncbi:MAG: NAD-dependent epimerase/dehydratase family protein [Chloroflexota bacterium]|nr:MAG: NAD-dependent epimerase/dehydratase family protein [Chloroflexota bacterium]
MTAFAISASQVIPADLDRTWAFFSDPANLRRITPASLGFEMRTALAPAHEGQLIEYTIRPIAGIPLRWRTRIEAVDAPRTFSDVQLEGPYRRWVHRHTFTAVDGGTRIDDHIEYELPFGPLGRLAHRLAVKAQLQAIFAFRAEAVRTIFEPGPPPAASRRTVAVAGGSGFVGSGIAMELRRRGERVVVLTSRGALARGPLPDDIELRTVDIRQSDGLASALDGIDRLVISLAFPGSPIEQPRRGNTFLEVDAMGTERLVAAAKEAGVRRVLYLSGAGAAPDARRHWFRAKWRAEEAVRASGMDWTILRPTWIFGPRDVSLNRFLGFARILPFVPMTNSGRQLLAPIFIDDVAAIAADALASESGRNRVFEIGGPETLSMREIIARALRVAGIRRPILPAPSLLVKLAALPMTLLPSPPLSPDAVDFINQPATVDMGPVLAALPRTLTTLDDGLATYLGSASPESTSVTFS